MARHGRHYNYLTPFFVRHTRRAKKNSLLFFFLFLFSFVGVGRADVVVYARVRERDTVRTRAFTPQSHTRVTVSETTVLVQWCDVERAHTHTHMQCTACMRALKLSVGATKTKLATNRVNSCFPESPD